MSICTPAALRETLGVGPVYTDADLQSICDTVDDVLLPMLWTNAQYNNGHSCSSNIATLYFPNYVGDQFYIGQTITVAGNGAHFNGNKTVTAVTSYTVSYALTHDDRVYHAVSPLGTVTGEVNTDYSTESSVFEAAVMIATDVFQAKNSASGGQLGPDMVPTPWRMGNGLLAKVRGLLAHTLSPGGFVG